MNGLGPVGAYAALFAEVGFVLLLTILAGVLAGYWVDNQLGSVPIFVLIGLFVGMSAGAVAVHRMVTRFLSRFD
jgi:F0F1-type ATP synthase assembly protein I